MAALITDIHIVGLQQLNKDFRRVLYTLVLTMALYSRGSQHLPFTDEQN